MSHDCLLYLGFEQCDTVETHGLDCGPFERRHDERWVCGVCGEVYTDAEAMRLVGDVTPAVGDICPF